MKEVRFSFGIISSYEFFYKLLQEYKDFDKYYPSARHAINCAITSWHLTDWTFNEFYIDDPKYQDEEKTRIRKGKKQVIKISGIGKYQNQMIKKCPELKYMRLIANGNKHCILRNSDIIEKTVIYKGDYNYDYSRHDYDVDKFEIVLKKNKKIDFEETLCKTIKFWRVYISHNIYKNKGKNK